MLIDRRLLIHFDWPLVGLVLVIAAVGILNLYSNAASMETVGTPAYLKQLSWLIIGLAVMVVIAFVEYRYYSDFAYFAYGAAVFSLLLVMAFGMVTSGAQRWIRVGPFSFQPSEFCKIALILALAKIFQRPPGLEGYSLRELFLPFLLLLLPTLLILKQPDLGTAIILFMIFLSVLFFVKVSWSAWLIMIVAGGSILPVLWSFLKGYQKRRILTFLNPDLDPLGAGYHVIQSKIAVGSGGVLGKGLMHGTQCKLGFLPEQQTDFIFSAFAEEWGLVGCVVLVALYGVLIWWGLRITVQAKDRFSAILSFGVVAMLFWHMFINIGMVLGIMPVAGIPLPLFSYGGSFLVSTLMGIGILLNVSMRRYLF